MKKFIIGALILLVGIPGFAFNFFDFLILAAGVVPVFLIISGAIAVYLGIEELKQSDSSNDPAKIDLSHTPRGEIDKERAGKPEGRTKPDTDTKSTKPAPDPAIEKEDKQAGKQQGAQPDGTAPPPSTSVTQDSEPPAPGAGAPADVQFKGNIETLVFHSVACNFASGKNCSMDFITKEDAEAQGYKPCKICMPDA